ncbi:hypothetical protein MLD52_14265 [Puniceicoccaceae bacterium K14]|nr:hypothetical protein [Puniceicoccaceae bacterium K14]
MNTHGKAKWLFLIQAIFFIAIGWVIGINFRSTEDNKLNASQGPKPIAGSKTQTTQGTIPSRPQARVLATDRSLSSLVGQLEQNSPSKDLAEKIFAFPLEEHQPWMVQMLLKKWAKESPTEALNYLTTLDNEYSGTEFLEIVLLNVTPENFEETLAWLQNNQGNKDYLITAAYTGLARSFPQQAMELASHLEEGSLKSRITQAAVNEWAKTDARSVLQWIENAPFNTSLQDLYATTMTYYIEQDPQTAGDLIESMENGSLKASLSSQYARQLSRNDPVTAVEWALNISHSESRKTALGVAFDTWSNVDFESAFSFALNLPDTDPSQRELLKQTAIRLSREDPIGAVETISQFPQNMNSEVTQHMALTLSEHNPQAAENWIQSLENGEMRDNAIKGALYEFRERDPQIAFELSSSVKNKRLQFELIQKSANAWYRIDPQATESAVSNSNRLSNQQKYTILSNLLENGEPINIVLP